MSKQFGRTSKTHPKDEISLSSQLLMRAGYIDKVSAGVYTLLPLGLKVINRINAIIRDEMDALGAQEILMSGLIPRQYFEKTGRWNNFDALFKLKGVDSKEYALGATHEEIVSPLAKKFVHSYKDLPLGIYQIQNKFRNEQRAKSGVLRTREFLMKDLYSFHKDSPDLDEYYERVKEAYFEIFRKCGIGSKTYLTFASGGAFSKYSHEFQTETEAGEDEIYLCKGCGVGLNKELVKDEYECPECKGKDYGRKKCVEVGNIFKLGTRFSGPFDLRYVNEKGEEKPVIMGCYGIGIQRLMGTIVEASHDKQGIIWPKEVSPYDIHLINLKENASEADSFYKNLSRDFEVLYDDRGVSAGEKFADADLIGVPVRIVVSEKSSPKIEIKKRDEKEAKLVEPDKISQLL